MKRYNDTRPSGLTNQQILSRAIVQHLKTNHGWLSIIASDGTEYRFSPDAKLAHDIALAVQDHLRRTGRDYSQKANSTL